MHFKHGNFNPMQLQHLALRLIAELNRMELDSVSHIVGTGRRGHGMKFAGTMLFVRQKLAGQARILLKQVEQAMAMNAVTPAGPNA
jgi:hypothetical protein